MCNLFDLKGLRTDLKISQYEVAELLGLPQSSISAMENGRTKISQETIDKLVERYGINPDDYMMEASTYIRNGVVKGRYNGNFNVVSKCDSKITTMYEKMLKDCSDRYEAERKDREAAEAKLKDAESKVEDFRTRLEKATALIYELKLLLIKNGVDVDIKM